MWRAFFYSVGYMTIFVGLQSLAFERVQLAPGKDVLQIVKRSLREDLAGQGAQSAGREGLSPLSSDPLLARSSNPSGSAFGPSRYSNGGFGGSAFSAAPYRDLTQNGGLGTGSGQSSGVPRVDLAGYQSQVRSTGLRQGTAAQGKIKTGRVIQTKDWMPWSLLATGAVIVLYTRSFRRHP